MTLFMTFDLLSKAYTARPVIIFLNDLLIIAKKNALILLNCFLTITATELFNLLKKVFPVSFLQVVISNQNGTPVRQHLLFKPLFCCIV